IRVGVVVDVEREVALGADLEVRPAHAVADADDERVGGWLPEQCDFEAVVRAVSELSAGGGVAGFGFERFSPRRVLPKHLASGRGNQNRLSVQSGLSAD